ncbi:hypothetical protein Sjap_012056 [Stephania japonica]|uniref:glucan endo-1,3-beta-D-glucosidase n=1 Tax=Stephania japonica TaxID=461633 RepID=A0AAP0JCQ6_9MAGN
MADNPNQFPFPTDHSANKTHNLSSNFQHLTSELKSYSFPRLNLNRPIPQYASFRHLSAQPVVPQIQSFPTPLICNTQPMLKSHHIPSPLLTLLIIETNKKPATLHLTMHLSNASPTSPGLPSFHEFTGNKCSTVTINMETFDWILKHIAKASTKAFGVFAHWRNGPNVHIMETVGNKVGCSMKVSILANGKMNSIFVPAGYEQKGWCVFEAFLNKYRGDDLFDRQSKSSKWNLAVVFVVVVVKKSDQVKWMKANEEISFKLRRNACVVPISDDRGLLWCCSGEENNFVVLHGDSTLLNCYGWHENSEWFNRRIGCSKQWIGIDGLPLELWSRASFESIGNLCGGLMEVAPETTDLSFLCVAKLKLKGWNDGFISENLSINVHGRLIQVRLFRTSESKNISWERLVDVQTKDSNAIPFVIGFFLESNSFLCHSFLPNSFLGWIKFKHHHIYNSRLDSLNTSLACGVCAVMASFRFALLVAVYLLCSGHAAAGLGANWGTRASHPLPGRTVVQLLKDNGFDKVKLFEPDDDALRSLGNSGIQVMVGVPNEFLAPFASNVQFAINWVMKNVSTYISKYGVDIRYVAVGNEPFLKTYQQTYQSTTFPALKNVQAALIKAGLGRQVKATVPLNADVYQSDNNLPSSGDFRPDIHPLMLSIIKFLSDNTAPLTINIYPFLSLYADPNFPIDFAFFSGSAQPLVDGPITYTNVFDANFDTLISALEKNGFPSIPVIVGEVGWPTDGDRNANLNYARRFNQGLIDRIVRGQGTPKRSTPPDIYIFGLIDEDVKSVAPGNFERHWGLFNYDGTVKYPLNVRNGRSLVPAKGVRYLSKQWCVMSPEASPQDPNFAADISKACTYGDCTSLGSGSSCGNLDVKGNASYAFNSFFQMQNQMREACQFSGLSMITTSDPSKDSCRFEIMIDLGKHEKASRSPAASSGGRGGNSVMVIAVIVTVSNDDSYNNDDDNIALDLVSKKGVNNHRRLSKVAGNSLEIQNSPESR